MPNGGPDCGGTCAPLTPAELVERRLPQETPNSFVGLHCSTRRARKNNSAKRGAAVIRFVVECFMLRRIANRGCPAARLRRGGIRHPQRNHRDVQRFARARKTRCGGGVEANVVVPSVGRTEG